MLVCLNLGDEIRKRLKANTYASASTISSLVRHSDLRAYTGSWSLFQPAHEVIGLLLEVISHHRGQHISTPRREGRFEAENEKYGSWWS